jgi:ATP-dependent phosphoenolpyruvate carboxykinase
VGELYEYALLPDYLTTWETRKLPTKITDTGALAAYSGSKTGRTPKEKRCVEDETTKDVKFSFF